jgi:hypothetical protein
LKRLKQQVENVRRRKFEEVCVYVLCFIYVFSSLVLSQKANFGAEVVRDLHNQLPPAPTVILHSNEI